MRKIAFFLIAVCQLALADDVTNCKWDNGEPMSEAACEDQRLLHGYFTEEERARVVAKRARLLDEAIKQEERRELELSAQRRKKCAGMSRRELTGKEKSAIMEAIRFRLKDPESAKFKWMKVVVHKLTTDGYCAIVNAKNSYGGYVGYKPFEVTFATNKSGNVEVIDANLEDVSSACAEQCYDDLSLAR